MIVFTIKPFPLIEGKSMPWVAAWGTLVYLAIALVLPPAAAWAASRYRIIGKTGKDM